MACLRLQVKNQQNPWDAATCSRCVPRQCWACQSLGRSMLAVARLTRNARNSSMLMWGCLDGVALLSMHAARCVLADRGPKNWSLAY